MPPTDLTLNRRQKLIFAGVTALVVLVLALPGGFGVHGAWPRSYERVEAEEVQPATNTGLGRAVAAMHDLHYLCTEGTSARQGVRSFACTGPEGWAAIEGTAAGKVTYLTLIGRADEMSADRAAAVGRALVNGADLGQDAKIAARSITDGRAGSATGPWGTASSGELPTRLVFVGSDRVKADKPVTLGSAATLSARLAKQSCQTRDKPVPSTPASKSASSAASAPPASAPAAPASPASAPASAASAAPATLTGPATITTCTASNRLVTTTITYEKVGDQVTALSVRSAAPFAYGWTHTEAIAALRLALTDLGLDATVIGDWVAANVARQGTVNLGNLTIDLNDEAPRSVTSVSVTRVA